MFVQYDWNVKSLNLAVIGILSIIITGMVLSPAFSESIQLPIAQNLVKALPYGGTQFDLKIGETFSQESGAFKIKLLNVTSDSRCPLTAYCIWQGQTTVIVGVTQGDKYLDNFTLSTLSGHDKIVFGKYVLLLAQVNPPALIGKKISQSDYVITFVISEAGVGSPLKQLKSGVDPKDVKCSPNFQLIIKAANNSPACVQPSTAVKLVALGWAKISENGGVFVTLAEGKREGPLLVQKILSDGIQGLNFLEYPLATNFGRPITLHLGDVASNGCTVELTLVKISNGTATFLKKENHTRICPICLSENTVIDTPNGHVNVKNLNDGMLVFTQDISGHKQTATISKTGRTLAPPNHVMIHVILDDNRELYASPNHPTADGRFFGDLLKGDYLDGSKIKSADRVSYNGTYTYDLLPSGQTGYYWANGILVASTLK